MKNSFRFLIFLLIILLLFQRCNNDIITPAPEDPDKPIANAGYDKNISAGQYLIIDGTQSDKKNGDTLIYNWKENVNNPYKNVLGAMAYSKKFYAIFPFEGNYIFNLVVNNGKKDSDKDSVLIRVLPRQKIIFSDTFLEISIRNQLGNPTEEIKEQDLLSITSLNGYKEIYDYDGIDKCINIKTLSLESTKQTNFSKIESLENLKVIALRSTFANKIYKQDISPIFNNPSVDTLYMQGLNLSEINVASEKSIELISIYFCELQNTSFLTKTKSIKHLDLEGTKVTNLVIYPELTSLTHLDLQQQGLNSIPSIPQSVPLKTLILSVNQISDISNIVSCKSLTKLYLSLNKIENISPVAELTNLEVLSINNNLVSDIEPLLTLSKLKSVTLSKSSLNEKSLNEYVPALRAKGVTVTLL